METRSLKRPGGAIAARPLHFIWLADCSGSMSEDGKIQALNHAIREAIPHMRKVADENPNANVLVRALGFSTDAFWHVPKPVPVEQFIWTDLVAKGQTAMGKALEVIAEEMRHLTTAEKVLPPVLVLLSDGQPTDYFDDGLRQLMAQSLGRKAVRVAIAIGDNADLDCLRSFIGDPSRPPLQAHNPETLVRYIQWASTAVLGAASSPLSQNLQTMAQGTGGVPIPQPPPPATDGNVW
jgi:uncharacterized protein YegL